ncbi:D-inositol 3-phosphate glycosyltransferase-like [Ylistrum balloti]|uniref:D-inositol 3-phosphate glycosyltransferase-like n=1 Tax=Ylistrum balloti TaxID=509963 RepID=UPI002905D905|nr:D-inositol 3-phosphate glycosyltransferase-like [Ylistrum balloti]
MDTKIAFAHDWAVTYAGSEKVVDAVTQLYPEAPLYTLFYEPEVLKNTFLAQRPVKTSSLDRFHFLRKRHRTLLPIMPFLWEQFDVGNYDIVFSSCHAAAKGILTRADQLHISYIHTPIRYAWDLYHPYLQESKLTKGIRGFFAKCILHYLRLWDFQAAQRVDYLIANSNYVARRIQKIYRRPATVIYPPVDVELFSAAEPREDFYVTMSRFVPYKRIDLIVEAFTNLNKPLKVIGTGPDVEKIRRLAGPNVELLGYLPNDVAKSYLERCRAFVFAADEDFGITPVEAQAAGAPVIAFERGGCCETVIAGKTGLFFKEQTVKSLVAAINDFEAQGTSSWDSKAISAHAQKFSRQRFQQEIKHYIEEAWSKFCLSPT